MKNITTSASRWLLVIAALIAALSSTNRAANYSQGDEITLSRNEPLLFRDQVFRQGRKGEKFTVLVHRQETKKVFISATDKAGKQIALSVPEDAVAPIAAEGLSPKTLTIEQIAAKTNEPQNFVGVLIGDAGRFPFTAFTHALKTKDWVTATSIAMSASDTIKERIKLIDEWSLFSPLEFVVMAQAESGDLKGAGETCNKIQSNPELARARRVIVTKHVANGSFEMADINLGILELRDAQRVPEDDYKKMKKGDYVGLSKAANGFIVAHSVAIDMIIQGLAAKGKIQEAIGYMKRGGGDPGIAAASIAEAKAAFGDPDALAFGREFTSKFKKSDPPVRFWIAQAQAKGFSKAGQRPLALEIIANALADAPKDDEKARLLEVRAELHRDSGDKVAAKQDIIEALATLDQDTAIGSKVLRSALAIAPDEIKVWSKNLRAKFLKNISQQSRDFDRTVVLINLLDLGESLFSTGDREEARVTSKEAFQTLQSFKNTDPDSRGSSAMSYCDRMLRYGETGNVEEALALVTDKQHIRRLSEWLAFTRAKQQKLAEARATLNGEFLSAESVDLIGAGFIGWDEIVKRICNLEPFSK